jgi:beta-N-acetylhexosaminidase
MLPREQIVPLTIAAGCDMFLFSKNLEEDLEFMRRGYEKGVFDRARLDEAVTRILALKASLSLPEKAENNTLVPDVDRAKEILGQKRFQDWGLECADRAITLVKQEAGIFPITPKRFPRVLFYATENLGRAQLPMDNPANPNARFLQMLRDAGFEVTLFVPQKVTEGAQPSVNELKSKYDLIIYSMAKKPNYQVLTRIKWDEPQGASILIYCHTIPTVFVSFENPYYLLDVPHMRTYINCYSDTRTTMEALLDKMMGKRPFCGVSPVDAFCGKWETRVSFGPSLELDKR